MITYLKYSVRPAWVLSKRGWKIYDVPNDHPTLNSCLSCSYFTSMFWVYVSAYNGSFHPNWSSSSSFIHWINVPSRTSRRVFFLKFLKYIHWRWSPALISIKCDCHRWAGAFLQKCCYKWWWRKCLGLDVADLIIIIYKRWKSPIDEVTHGFLKTSQVGLLLWKK
jgi:hypothetical protein